MRTLLQLVLASTVLATSAFAADPAEALCECAKTAVACGGPECTCAKVAEGTQCPLHRPKAAHDGAATGKGLEARKALPPKQPTRGADAPKTK